ncbi:MULTISPECIES: bifunctional DNA primase/polymerase [Bradyrhizobium]|uniref:bifunctional DNA primase/polymerase n=1 Tax=Bradyrhizobium TaxID=374 RepID=UPI00068A1A70|nr:bifunctional DNA primase/polymerase [Bradyrhizobium japonicum]MBR0734869.1 bifunctional DNA primase/polymerase [Bradyrhizobium japonicum]MCD9112225.1 bifunctional DNA primase/polymerase [Bradyrhizobium japonicum]MCD9258282.1 bifunctional DNA primase/polymerase [Bradyrhizobium japonicum SEMIA 5079]MCD9824464.1 bifunctional DNA primase/polymerase [Bradyrhizobium japonicum]MCD9897605.1 bifunctional DNA primase/polymerase [Bradyrhizobium japonicum]
MGDDTDYWPGHRVELYPTTTTLRGITVDCIRIRALSPKAPPAAEPDEKTPSKETRRDPNRLPPAAPGLYILPCRPRDKRPATANGLKEATTDPNIISEWWRQQPDNNIAIATGAASGIFVVDVDGLDAEALLRQLEVELGPCRGVEVITARGRHIYFRWPHDPVRNSAGKIARHIDMRGEGGYVLSPPSIRPTGRPYCWSVNSATQIADAPGWLLSKQKGATASATSSSEWRTLVYGVSEGARDCGVAELAGHLLRHNINPFVVVGLLQSWNATHCTPPLPSGEVESIV